MCDDYNKIPFVVLVDPITLETKQIYMVFKGCTDYSNYVDELITGYIKTLPEVKE